MEHSAEKFWIWFEEHQTAYSFLNQVSSDVKEQLMSDFTIELHRYCDKLYFEIGGDSEICDEVVITAEGNRDYFPQVEILVAAAPNLDKWKVTAFIPPRDVHFEMDYEGLVLNPEEMWFMPLHNQRRPHEVGIRVFLRNHDLAISHDFFESAMYKILDVLLGEKSAALDINYVDFAQLSDTPNDDLIELSELPNYIAWKKNSA